MNIIPLTEAYFQQTVTLANAVHGDNYLDLNSLTTMVEQGCKDGINASFIAVENEQVIGLRLTFSAQQWHIDKWCSPALWGLAEQDVAYFKCIAIDSSQQGKGIGPQLLSASIDALKAQGAKAAIAHLWKQSPGNGAVKYFTKAGGKLIKLHPDRWLENTLYHGYHCALCGNECHCEAAEMLLLFD